MVAVTLQVGQSISVELVARECWNATGVVVAPGQRYAFTATGEWNDGGIPCGPDGFVPEQAPLVSRWLVKAAAPLLRLKNRRYICVVGSVARRPESFFAIGRGLRSWPTEQLGGQLECFANDVPFAYFNNRGSVQMKPD